MEKLSYPVICLTEIYEPVKLQKTHGIRKEFDNNKERTLKKFREELYANILEEKDEKELFNDCHIHDTLYLTFETMKVETALGHEILLLPSLTVGKGRPKSRIYAILKEIDGNEAIDMPVNDVKSFFNFGEYSLPRTLEFLKETYESVLNHNLDIYSLTLTKMFGVNNPSLAGFIEKSLNDNDYDPKEIIPSLKEFICFLPEEINQKSITFNSSYIGPHNILCMSFDLRTSERAESVGAVLNPKEKLFIPFEACRAILEDSDCYT